MIFDQQKNKKVIKIIKLYASLKAGIFKYSFIHICTPSELYIICNLIDHS